MDTTHWNKADFLSFLLYYVANADGELHEDELIYIEDKLGEERLAEVEHLTNHQSDYEIINLISDLRNRFYPGKNGKDQLLQEMKMIAAADGEISQMEKLAIKTIDKIL